MRSVVIVDHGAGNLGSIAMALEDAGASIVVSAEPSVVRSGLRVCLPGVGSFFSAMRTLRETGLAEAIVDAVAVRGVPLLGVCLGAQLACERGDEGGETEGLGLVNGYVRRLPCRVLPHTGWNEVVTPDERFFLYHNHAYEIVMNDDGAQWKYGWGVTEYEGYAFNSWLRNGTCWLIQGHPEKSQAAGLRVLKNWLEAA